MKVIKGKVVKEGVATILLLGDGARDERITKSIAEKYDHTKTMLIPIIGYSKTGLQGVIDTLTHLTSIIKVNRFTIIIDKEHVNSIDDVRRELTKRGFEVKSIKPLTTGSWEINCIHGSRNITILLATLGLTSREHIEESMSKIIKLLYNEDVKPRKHAINAWLRKHNLRDRELIEKAPIDKLKQAFPNLTTLIEHIAKDP